MKITRSLKLFIINLFGRLGRTRIIEVYEKILIQCGSKKISVFLIGPLPGVSCTGDEFLKAFQEAGFVFVEDDEVKSIPMSAGHRAYNSLMHFGEQNKFCAVKSRKDFQVSKATPHINPVPSH